MKNVNTGATPLEAESVELLRLKLRADMYFFRKHIWVNPAKYDSSYECTYWHQHTFCKESKPSNQLNFPNIGGRYFPRPSYATSNPIAEAN